MAMIPVLFTAVFRRVFRFKSAGPEQGGRQLQIGNLADLGQAGPYLQMRLSLDCISMNPWAAVVFSGKMLTYIE